MKGILEKEGMQIKVGEIRKGGKRIRGKDTK
jgi:hypothetical protein